LNNRNLMAGIGIVPRAHGNRPIGPKPSINSGLVPSGEGIFFGSWGPAQGKLRPPVRNSKAFPKDRGLSGRTIGNLARGFRGNWGRRGEGKKALGGRGFSAFPGPMGARSNRRFPLVLPPGLRRGPIPPNGGGRRGGWNMGRFRKPTGNRKAHPFEWPGWEEIVPTDLPGIRGGSRRPKLHARGRGPKGGGKGPAMEPRGIEGSRGKSGNPVGRSERPPFPKRRKGGGSENSALFWFSEGRKGPFLGRLVPEGNRIGCGAPPPETPSGPHGPGRWPTRARACLADGKREATEATDPNPARWEARQTRFPWGLSPPTENGKGGWEREPLGQRQGKNRKIPPREPPKRDGGLKNGRFPLPDLPFRANPEPRFPTRWKGPLERGALIRFCF